MNVPTVEHASIGYIALTALFLGPPLFFIYLARKGWMPHLRRIPGIDAIEEAVGRATEMGRPVSFTTGLSPVGPTLFACLGIMGHIIRLAAKFATRVLILQNDPEVMAIVEEVAREHYRSEGKADLFRREDIRYLSGEQFAFASGYMGTVHREGVASCFLFGAYAAESLILAEAGQQMGAMQVAGTASNAQIPFFLTTCDYTLIGEELFAAGAYLSRDPVQVGSVVGQDYAKLIAFGLIAVGILAYTLFGQDWAQGLVDAVVWAPGAP